MQMRFFLLCPKGDDSSGHSKIDRTFCFICFYYFYNGMFNHAINNSKQYNKT